MGLDIRDDRLVALLKKPLLKIVHIAVGNICKFDDLDRSLPL